MVQEGVVRSDLRACADNLEREHNLRDELHRMADEGRAAEEATAHPGKQRGSACDPGGVDGQQGTGFLLNHSAQRWACQALFFLAVPDDESRLGETLAAVPSAVPPALQDDSASRSRFLFTARSFLFANRRRGV